MRAFLSVDRHGQHEAVLYLLGLGCSRQRLVDNFVCPPLKGVRDTLAPPAVALAAGLCDFPLPTSLLPRSAPPSKVLSAHCASPFRSNPLSGRHLYRSRTLGGS